MKDPNPGDEIIRKKDGVRFFFHSILCSNGNIMLNDGTVITRDQYDSEYMSSETAKPEGVKNYRQFYHNFYTKDGDIFPAGYKFEIKGIGGDYYVIQFEDKPKYHHVSGQVLFAESCSYDLRNDKSLKD